MPTPSLHAHTGGFPSPWISLTRAEKSNTVYIYSMQPLTAKQQALADFIESHRREHGAAPTFQEIADHFRFRSVNAVTSHIRLLRRKGYLASDSRKARSLQVISPLAKLRGIVDIPSWAPSRRFS